MINKIILMQEEIDRLKHVIKGFEKDDYLNYLSYQSTISDLNHQVTKINLQIYELQKLVISWRETSREELHDCADQVEKVVGALEIFDNRVSGDD